MQQANDNINRQQANGNGAATNGTTSQEKKKEPIGDYIDFEEIK